MKFALIPTGACDWRTAGRLLGRVQLALTSEGEKQCDAFAESLRVVGISTVYHGRDELSKHTAKRVARAVDAATRATDKLREVDLGLWAGLTDADLKSRFATAHRQLRESPLTVRPPEGEPLSEAAERLESYLRRTLRRNGKTPVAFVLRPLSMAIADCVLAGKELSDLYAMSRAPDEPRVLKTQELPAPVVKD
jgi:probable phosphoglycerate mutase